MSGSEPDDNLEDDLDEDRPAPGDSEPGNSTGLSPKMEAWRRRSAAGAILTGFALGLQEALEPKRDEPSIMVQTSGDPPADLPVEAEFEYRRPRKSVVSIRPWLIESDRQPSGDPTAGSEADQDGPEENQS